MTALPAAAARLHPYTSHYYGYYHPGAHISAGRTLLLVIVLIIGYAVLHAVIGFVLHPFNRRRHGHRANLGWSLRRGWWGSWRLGRRTTVYERL